jgi:Class II flagellar assembly regulator
MKIDPTAPARSAGSARRTERAGGARSGEFARHLDSSTSSAGVSGGSPVGPVNTFLSIQEVDDPLSGGRKRAAKRAEDILDELDALREGLLTGGLSRESIIRLAGLVRARRPEVTSPELNEVLDEIELRAEVELAKLDGRMGER